jgi:hypothetical protein
MIETEMSRRCSIDVEVMADAVKEDDRARQLWRRWKTQGDSIEAQSKGEANCEMNWAMVKRS